MGGEGRGGEGREGRGGEAEDVSKTEAAIQFFVSHHFLFLLKVAGDNEETLAPTCRYTER